MLSTKIGDRSLVSITQEIWVWRIFAVNCHTIIDAETSIEQIRFFLLDDLKIFRPLKRSMDNFGAFPFFSKRNGSYNISSENIILPTTYENY